MQNAMTGLPLTAGVMAQSSNVYYQHYAYVFSRHNIADSTVMLAWDRRQTGCVQNVLTCSEMTHLQSHLDCFQLCIKHSGLVCEGAVSLRSLGGSVLDFKPMANSLR